MISDSAFESDGWKYTVKLNRFNVSNIW